MLTSSPHEQRRAAPVRQPGTVPPVALTGLFTLLAVAVTLAVSFLPFVQFAYEAPELHVALETLAAVVAVLLAFLVHGRFRQWRRLQDLLLSLSLGLVAVANLLLAALPDALELGGDAEFGTWAPLVVRLLGAVLLAASALTPWTRLVARPGTTARAVVLLVIGTAVALAALYLARPLPVALDPSLDLRDTRRAFVVGHPLLLAAQAAGALLYGVAAIGYTRQATRTADDLVRWLGAACVLAAFARVNYVLFPSLYSQYVYTGDLLRLAFFLVLLFGAAREISSYWQAQSRAAVLEDRRRMARDLHDGLAQELSYIWTQSRRLAADGPPDPAVAERIGGAAGRALDEARRAIAALTRPVDDAFSVVMQQTLDEMAMRYDVRVTTDLDADTAVTQAQCEALLRIAGEAVRNAVRHGGASTVHVVLRASPLSLDVTDDGDGFDPSTATSATGGFGLTSMRERAVGLGARLTVESAPGDGTRVAVQWG